MALDKVTRVGATQAFIPESIIATAGQTVINVSSGYLPGTNTLAVLVNGLAMQIGADFSETSESVVTMVTPLELGDKVTTLVYKNKPIGTADSANVSYAQGAPGSVVRNLGDKLRESVSVLDFGAVGDGVTDDTAAVQAAYDYCASNGEGGTLYFPAGVYSVTGISKIYDGPYAPVNILGAGMRVTTISKRGTSTAALFNISSLISQLTLYQTISDLTITGNNGSSSHPGFKLTNYAYCTLNSVEINRCKEGVLGYGVLVCSFNNCYVHNNYDGYKFLKSTDNVYCNDVSINGGSIVTNSNHGVEFITGTGFTLSGVDIETNGTFGNSATGGIYLGDGVIAEIGLGSVTVRNCWFEANLGWAFSTHASASAGNVNIENTMFLNSESGQAIKVPLSKQLSLSGVIAPGASDTAQIYGDDCNISNSIIQYVTDTSARKTYLGLIDSSGPNNRVSAKNTAAAWVRFNGTGTPAIISSFNVASVTRTGTGTYTVTLSEALPNTNYLAMCAGQSGLTDVFFAFPATGSTVTVETYVGGALADKSNVTLSVFG